MPVMNCPWCETRVLVKTNGECPSCGNRADEEPEKKPASTQQQLPLPVRNVLWMLIFLGKLALAGLVCFGLYHLFWLVFPWIQALWLLFKG